MYRIETLPTIAETVSTRDGYRSRVLCLLDGFPGEISLIVNSHIPAHSSYTISVWDHVRGVWVRVYEIEPDEVGHMPIIRDDIDTLVRLNELAQMLHIIASAVLSTARERQDGIDRLAKVADQRAVDDYRFDRDVDAERLDPWPEHPSVPDGALESDSELAALRAKLAGDDPFEDLVRDPITDEPENADDADHQG